jgi:nitrogen fixation NifU-like protein
MTVTDRLDDIYDEHILDHYESPYHKGHLPHPTCAHCDRNPICGDQICLELKVDGDRVAQAYFDGKGCAISQAAASILCEHVEGKSLEELRGLQAKDMLELLRVRLTPSRQKCGLLGFKVLKTMLYSLEAPEQSAGE